MRSIQVRTLRARTVAALALLILSALPAASQNFSLSANAGDLLCLGTLNVRASVAVARHWSVQADARWNPWTFSKGDAASQTQLRQRTFSAGARWWPWYVHSGFFACGRIQYQEYNFGGFGGRLATEEGDAWGLALDVGYAFMLSHRFNLEVGVGGWTGLTRYTSYACPYCGQVTGQGTKWFLRPNELILSFTVVL